MSAAKNANGRSWTVADIPTQVGRRALVTGANSGIGYCMALELARNGAYVLLGCRDKAKGDAAAARIHAEDPRAKVEVAVFDLASLDSVRAFAAAELARRIPLDLLINNAGVYRPKKRLETVDGFELQFGTNVLGHFALTALMLPALERAVVNQHQKPRVVTIASIAHKKGWLNFDDLQSRVHYDSSESYAQSKLANLMLAFELERRLRAAGSPASGVMSVAAHPGVASTNLFQAGEFHPLERAARRGVSKAIGLLLNTDVEGALPTLYAATAPGVTDGGYYGPQGFHEMRGGDVGLARVARRALDRTVTTRLWKTCEQLTGISLL